MKNVTITVEDTTLEWVRIEAAKRNTSVSRLVGEMLTDKMQHDELEVARAEQPLASAATAERMVGAHAGMAVAIVMFVVFAGRMRVVVAM